jgi:transcription elongation factor GreB
VVVKREDSEAPREVRFGATVALRDEAGKESRYTIVGPDETDPNSGRISFESPLGRSLMKKGIGDVVTVRRPAGEVEVTVLEIEYE